MPFMLEIMNIYFAIIKAEIEDFVDKVYNSNENESSPIENPEEIIVFDNLQRAGSTPTILGFF